MASDRTLLDLLRWHAAGRRQTTRDRIRRAR
jgi:hypothetical protein